eukprot:TRINITY_DN602_c0_g2_i2.p1 TRINITY_DN602_c0_g2~~TRINITY_DN602_c0_g2_i2.p1  ORF type:complete len:1029 (+),score=246.12 TRINITY_DN602_c0_g2_i2:58-3087(+)
MASAEITHCKIHPGIGVTRIGNAPSDYYLSPEYPGHPAKPPGEVFRDANKKVLRQVQRFRILGYDKDGNYVREITEAENTRISWTVELANKKCSWYKFVGRHVKEKPGFKEELRNAAQYPETDPEKRVELINAPGPRTVDSTNTTQKFEGGKIFGKEAPALGEIRYVEKGRLLVFGGHGNSASPYNYLISSYSNNDGWYDDTSDGPVNATVEIDGKKIEVTPAWITVAPPKFASEHKNLITLYDVMLDTALSTPELKAGLSRMPKDFSQYPRAEGEKVKYYRDIYPFFERVVQMSWLNEWAQKGHGISSLGNFLTPEWQTKLKSPLKEHYDLRKSIFFRLREPVEITDSAEKMANAVGQANTYFMPVMSGDDGDFRQSEPFTWLTLNPRAYENFKKWAEGDFEVEAEPDIWKKWNSLEELEKSRPDLVPWAMDLAPLEWCVGGPFYPGIEITYVVKDPSTFSEPFRINRNWKAGDATKHMALPWQADFNECEIHWWPAARPDTVLPNYTLSKSTDGASVASNPEDRQRWTRGFRVNESQIKWGDLDMVHNWDKLGFVTSKKIVDGRDEKKTVIDSYVEVDRLSVFIGEILPNRETTETLDTLLRYLKAAIRVELSTIPPYLFALYSVPDPVIDGIDVGADPSLTLPPAKSVSSKINHLIRSVVVEEMLHLALVANVLVAVSEDPNNLGFNFYHQTTIPKYPTNLPYKDKPLAIYLAPASHDVINTFAMIEQPDEPVAPPIPEAQPKTFLMSMAYTDDPGYVKNPEYLASAYKFETIGSFYEDIKKLIGTLNINWPDPKNPNYDSYTKLQMAPGTAYYPNFDNGGMILVTNKEDAFRALDIIIKQGEGSQTNNSVDNSHYHRFLSILKEDPSWEQLVSPADVELTKNYTFNEYATETNKAFNAVYCYSLKCLDAIYRTKDQDKKNHIIKAGLFGAMKNVLPLLAKLLMKIPIASGKTAGPTFEFYRFETGVSTKKQVVDQIAKASSHFDKAVTSLWNSVKIAAEHLSEVD